MRLIALTLALAISIAAVGAAAAKDWKEYSYPAYFFSVSFPAEPKIETTTDHAPDSRAVEARVFSVAQGNAVLKVTFVDLVRLAEVRAAEGAGLCKLAARRIMLAPRHHEGGSIVEIAPGNCPTGHRRPRSDRPA